MLKFSQLFDDFEGPSLWEESFEGVEVFYFNYYVAPENEA